MSSKILGAPYCKDCGRSDGIAGEAAGGVTWRKGAWRWDHEAEYIPDLTCPCGSMNIGEVK